MAEIQVIRPSNGHVLARFSLFSDRRYRLPTGDEIRVGIDYGWCHNCEDFSEAERIWTQPEIQENKDNLLLVTQSSAHSEIDAKLRKAIEWLHSRETPARCLTCGSIFGVAAIAPNEEQPHPNGDGIIVLTTDDTLGAPPSVQTPMYYTPDGSRLAGKDG